MEENKNLYVIPFSLVGVLITGKDLNSCLREDISEDEFQRVLEVLRDFLFKEDVEVEIYLEPYLVPPSQAKEVADEMVKELFEDEEG